MKTAEEILEENMSEFSLKYIDEMVAPGHDGKVPMLRKWILDAMHEFAAQSPAISRERLLEAMSRAYAGTGREYSHKQYQIQEIYVDAILSELGKPGQPDWAALEGKGLDTKLTHWEQPAPPVTLPTDEEIWAEAKAKYTMELGFDKGAKWMRSEIEKRMKGGEG